MRKLIILFVFLSAAQLYAQKVLTENQLDDLQTRWLDIKKKKKYVFYCDFEQPKLNPDNDKHESRILNYKKTGRVPFRMWAEFGVVTEFKSGKTSAELLAGQMAFYYIKNDSGSIVKHGREPIGRLIRRGALGGLFDDLPSEGTYTCVVYVKKDGMLFGKQMTVTFQGYK